MWDSGRLYGLPVGGSSPVLGVSGMPSPSLGMVSIAMNRHAMSMTNMTSPIAANGFITSLRFVSDLCCWFEIAVTGRRRMPRRQRGRCDDA